MRYFFIPNARFWVLLSIVALLLILPSIALAQDVPPSPPQAPDLSPIIANINDGLATFLTSAAVLMGALAFIVTQAAKFVLPKTETIKSETIYGAVVSIFTLLYVGANLAGYTDLLSRGVALGTVLADPILTLLGMLVIPSAAYAVGQKINNPLMGGSQGKGWGSLEKPKQTLRLEPIADVNAGQLASYGEVG